MLKAEITKTKRPMPPAGPVAAADGAPRIPAKKLLSPKPKGAQFKAFFAAAP